MFSIPFLERGGKEKAVKVLVPIADGSEEIETCTIINVLVRGGAEVTSASVCDKLQINGSRGIKIVADKFIGDCVNEQYDLIVCPGGENDSEFNY